MYIIVVAVADMDLTHACTHTQHAHTNTHTRTHTYTHAHTHTHTHTYTHAHIHTCAHTHTHTFMNASSIPGNACAYFIYATYTYTHRLHMFSHKQHMQPCTVCVGTCDTYVYSLVLSAGHAAALPPGQAVPSALRVRQVTSLTTIPGRRSTLGAQT